MKEHNKLKQGGLAYLIIEGAAEERKTRGRLKHAHMLNR